MQALLITLAVITPQERVTLRGRIVDTKSNQPIAARLYIEKNAR